MFDHLYIPGVFEGSGDLELDVYRLREYEKSAGNLDTKVNGAELPRIVILESTAMIYPYPIHIHAPSFPIQKVEGEKPTKGCKMMGFTNETQRFIDHIFMLTTNYFLDSPLYPIDIPSLCISGIRTKQLTGEKGRILEDFYLKDDIAFLPQAQLKVSKEFTLAQQVRTHYTHS